MGLLETLKSMIPEEAKIQGSTPEELVDAVDLSIEYTPVLQEFIHDAMILYHCIPSPCRVQKDGSRYCLMMGRDYRWIEVPQLKEMRARFLLVRGFYYANFDKFSYSQRPEIISKFFKGGMWRPAPGTELYKAMKLG